MFIILHQNSIIKLSRMIKSFVYKMYKKKTWTLRQRERVREKGVHKMESF